MPPDTEALHRAWLDQVAAGGGDAKAALDKLMEAYRGPFVRRLHRMRLDYDQTQEVIGKFWEELARRRELGLKPLRCPADRPLTGWMLTAIKFRGQRVIQELSRERGRVAKVRIGPHVETTAPGADKVAEQWQFAAALEALEGEDREALELVEGFYLRGWKIEQLCLWRYEQCRPRGRCNCTSGALEDCERATVAATRKAIGRARNLFRELMARYM